MTVSLHESSADECAAEGRHGPVHGRFDRARRHVQDEGCFLVAVTPEMHQLDDVAFSGCEIEERMAELAEVVADVDEFGGGVVRHGEILGAGPEISVTARLRGANTIDAPPPSDHVDPAEPATPRMIERKDGDSEGRLSPAPKRRPSDQSNPIASSEPNEHNRCGRPGNLKIVKR